MTHPDTPRSTVHRRVPEVRLPGQDLTSGFLVFGTGRLDESFARGGAAHLVEHLVMRRLGPTDVETNATTAPHHLSFEVHGGPDVVKDVLERIAVAIGSLESLTDEEVLAEKRIIDHELRSWSPHPSLLAVRERLGVRSEGLGAIDPPSRCFLTVSEVLRFARQHLVRENAVLVLTGPAPDDIDLTQLPSAERPAAPRGPATLLPLVTPGFVRRQGTPLSVSFLTSRSDPRHAVGVNVLDVLLHEQVRTRDQLAYTAEVDTQDIDTDSTQVSFTCDAIDDDAAHAALLVVRVLRQVAAEGVPEDVLERGRRRALALLDHPGWVVARAHEDAARALLGRTVVPVAEERAHVAATSAADVRGWLADALPTLLVVLADETDQRFEPQLASLGLVLADPPPPPLHGRTFRPKPFRGIPRGARLVLSQDAIGVVGPDLSVNVRDEDLVGLEDTSGGFVVVGVDGTTIPVITGDWWGTGSALASYLERSPHALRIPDSATCPCPRTDR
ncbi:insulinase family protein [Oerskovia sp. NPDC060287]|uniref:insulinase family protein n=1 Tax=Oerskovia sp. NPDC060287 TaxID=3347095 RepID=UPI003659F81D